MNMRSAAVSSGFYSSKIVDFSPFYTAFNAVSYIVFIAFAVT